MKGAAMSPASSGPSSGSKSAGDACLPARGAQAGGQVTYGRLAVFLSNVPYLVMLGLGAAIMAVGVRDPAWRWVAAGAYVAYGLAGALWIVVFVCPACPSYATRTCPCGYGLVASMLVKKADRALFARRFRRHVWVPIPLWFIPPAAAGWFAYGGAGRPVWALAGAFVLVAFVAIPAISRGHGCARCPQREDCPWMSGRRPPSPGPGPERGP